MGGSCGGVRVVGGALSVGLRCEYYWDGKFWCCMLVLIDKRPYIDSRAFVPIAPAHYLGYEHDFGSTRCSHFHPHQFTFFVPLEFNFTTIHE